jgi:CheY-like chemotaxis protein
MPKALEKGISLHFYAEPSIGKRLQGDPIRLRQVLINLLTNAVKFTQTGAVKVSSYIDSSTDSSITVHFEVRDSGIGMTPEQIELIKEPFMQADSSTTRKYGRTGLGLSISNSIISLMNGKLNVESTPGLGSKFSFDLTFDTIDVSTDLSDETVMVNRLEKPVFRGEILICEDNIMNQQVICDHLNRVGLRTVVAQNGKEGVDIIKSRIDGGEKPFDLILMDIYMPVMDGLEAAAAITELHISTPIVAMTANIMHSDKELYEMSGLPDCLIKPFTSQELWRCLTKYLNPVSVYVAVEREREQDAKENDEMQRRLRIKFAEDNRMKYNEIVEAISAGEIPLAHRLVHTLKNNAGMIGMDKLQRVAAEVEALLKDGSAPLWDGHMGPLKIELQNALDELKSMPVEPEIRAERESLNAEQIADLFAKLEPMLVSRNSECLSLLSDIYAVPGASELARQIEKYNFKLAARLLNDLKKECV